MAAAKHIINKVFLEVNTSSTKQAFNLKDNLSGFLRHRVFPKIEAYFETLGMAFPDTALRFDKIELNINPKVASNPSYVSSSSFNNIENLIVEALKKEVDVAFQREISHAKEKGLPRVSKGKRTSTAFFHFLRTGLKPWWEADLTDAFNKKNMVRLVSQKSFYPEFIEILSDEKVCKRLINQFDNDLLLLLFSLSNSKKNAPKKKIFSILEGDSVLKYKFWDAVIEYHRVKKTSKLKAVLHLFLDKGTGQGTSVHRTLLTFVNLTLGDVLEDYEIDIKKTQKERAKEENSKVDPLNGSAAIEKGMAATDGIYVNNAGLLLLHPFLKQFFINAQLADSKGKLIGSKIETAVHALHYLGAKQEWQLESTLVLEKFICNYPLDEPMDRFIKLTKTLKRMAEEVLQSAITHWKALKNTSPDGLRTGFLQRDGKLIVENGTFRLIVERKAQDVLLDKIPWNIHLIKLPWRDKIIFVEW